MRQEDFVVGLERRNHERGLLEENQEEFEAGDAKSYDEQVAESQIADRSHQDDVRIAVQSIFERRPLELDQLQLSKQEHSALEALRAAFNGKDARYNTFLYAEHRREMLEQALAALQPIFALDVSMSSEMQEEYAALVEQVTQLRIHLLSLEDSQDDELLQRESLKKSEEEGDKDDDGDGDKDDDGDGDADADLDDKRKAAKSTLFEGPEAPAKQTAKSTLSDGPAAPERVSGPSAAFDGEIEAKRDEERDESGAAAAGESGGGVGGGKGSRLSRIGKALGIGGGPKGKSDDGGKGSS